MCNVKYHISFEMNIFGCNLELNISDKKYLELLSEEDLVIDKIKFVKECEGCKLEGSLYTSQPQLAYYFVENKLKDLIIKVLVVCEDIKVLNIRDKVTFDIKNKDEIKKAGLPLIDNGSKYLSISPSIPYVSKDEFLNNLNHMELIEKKFDDALFWQYISYSVVDTNRGLTRHNMLSQYRLIWTAFNRIYKRLYPKLGERKSIEKYSEKRYVKEYFLDQFNNQGVNKYLVELSNGKLELLKNYGKDTIDISDKLREAMDNKESEDISKYSMLCLYSIRNGTIHGDKTSDYHLWRVGFELLNPLLKISLRKEIEENE